MRGLAVEGKNGVLEGVRGFELICGSRVQPHWEWGCTLGAGFAIWLIGVGERGKGLG